jgi:hypothetical protein
MNPEPITTRWMRGISWRMVREVIFGIGSAPPPRARATLPQPCQRGRMRVRAVHGPCSRAQGEARVGLCGG